jgi:UDP-N-acetylglucosamine 4,6-dehydratase
MSDPISVFNGKNILVTGGTGSFGQAFIKTLIEGSTPSRIVVYSRDELKQYEMQSEPVFADHQDLLRFFIGDVRDLARLNMAMASGVDFVVHAAALKQVPAIEYNPFEAIKTNIIGSQNVIDAALSNGVQKVVALSTDKAAAPINLYGASKLAADKLFQAANNYAGTQDTRFSVVRYGNVMGSRGSVIPFFIKVRESGSVPITDPRMTRFNITLLEGVRLVIDSFVRMLGGEIFVPRIPSYRVVDVATAIAPDAKQIHVGIRPGEKLHEEMITKGDHFSTIEYPDLFVILPSIKLKNEVLEFAERTGGTSTEQLYGDRLFSYSSDQNDHFLSVEEIQKLANDELLV